MDQIIGWVANALAFWGLVSIVAVLAWILLRRRRERRDAEVAAPERGAHNETPDRPASRAPDIAGPRADELANRAPRIRHETTDEL